MKNKIKNKQIKIGYDGKPIKIIEKSPSRMRAGFGGG